MVNALAEDLEAFGSHEMCIQCFLHIMDIVTGKNLIHQFNTVAACMKNSKDNEDNKKKEIMALAKELESLADTEVEDRAGGDSDDDGDEDLDGEELLDAVTKLSEDKWQEFETSSRPLKLLLTKVSHTVNCRARNRTDHDHAPPK